MERPEGYIVKTGPIIQLADAVTEALQGLDLGMTCTALTRVGKSVAMAHLGNRFQERKTAVWLYCSMTDDDGNKRVNANDLLRALRGDEEGDDAGLVHQRPLRALMNHCKNECDKLQTPVLVMGIDEAQELTYSQLKKLKHVTNLLVKEKLRPFVLLMAQPEMVHLRGLLLETGHPDLVVRFMNTQHDMHGLVEADLVAFCRAIDEYTWPAGSRTSYTAYWLPELWDAGWRTADAADPLWAAFVRLARSIHLDVGKLSVGGHYIAAALLKLMRLLKANPRGTQAASIYDEAVKASGFAEFSKVVVKSREAFLKDKAGRRWARSLS